MVARDKKGGKRSRKAEEHNRQLQEEADKKAREAQEEANRRAQEIKAQQDEYIRQMQAQKDEYNRQVAEYNAKVEEHNKRMSNVYSNDSAGNLIASDENVAIGNGRGLGPHAYDMWTFVFSGDKVKIKDADLTNGLRWENGYYCQT